MPLTRVTLATEIVDRAGGFLSAAGLSVAKDATNTIAMIAGRKALARVGVTPADPVALADADLTSVPASRAEEYLAAANLEALRLILQNCGGVDQQVGNHEQRLSQLRGSVVAAIEAAEKALVDEYGVYQPEDSAVSTANPAYIPNNPFDSLNSRSRYGYWPYP